MESKALVPVETIEQKILLIRGQKVMLDRDLAVLYEVVTFNLNKAVKRNSDRFPTDFMFQLTKEGTYSLKFQIGMSKKSSRGGRRYLPYAFTEQGVAMLSDEESTLFTAQFFTYFNSFFAKGWSRHRQDRASFTKAFQCFSKTQIIPGRDPCGITNCDSLCLNKL